MEFRDKLKFKGIRNNHIYYNNPKQQIKKTGKKNNKNLNNDNYFENLEQLNEVIPKFLCDHSSENTNIIISELEVEISNSSCSENKPEIPNNKVISNETFKEELEEKIKLILNDKNIFEKEENKNSIDNNNTLNSVEFNKCKELEINQNQNDSLQNLINKPINTQRIQKKMNINTSNKSERNIDNSKNPNILYKNKYAGKQENKQIFKYKNNFKNVSKVNSNECNRKTTYKSKQNTKIDNNSLPKKKQIHRRNSCKHLESKKNFTLIKVNNYNSFNNNNNDNNNDLTLKLLKTDIFNNNKIRKIYNYTQIINIKNNKGYHKNKLPRKTRIIGSCTNLNRKNYTYSIADIKNKYEINKIKKNIFNKNIKYSKNKVIKKENTKNKKESTSEMINSLLYKIVNNFNKASLKNTGHKRINTLRNRKKLFDFKTENKESTYRNNDEKVTNNKKWNSILINNNCNNNKYNNEYTNNKFNIERLNNNLSNIKYNNNTENNGKKIIENKKTIKKFVSFNNKSTRFSITSEFPSSLGNIKKNSNIIQTYTKNNTQYKEMIKNIECNCNILDKNSLNSKNYDINKIYKVNLFKNYNIDLNDKNKINIYSHNNKSCLNSKKLSPLKGCTNIEINNNKQLALQNKCENKNITYIKISKNNKNKNNHNNNYNNNNYNNNNFNYQKN